MSPLNRVPKHVAIIMDGNGRWAQKRHHPRVFGHVKGCSRIKAVVQEADRLGISALTLYAFSTENWSRPDAELQVLWKLLKRYLKRETEELDRQNVRLRIIGETHRLSQDVLEVLEPAVDKLSGNTGLQLTFAVSYGSRREITLAAQKLAHDCALGKVDPLDIDESLFEKYLWTSDLNELSNVDLVIRTSGEKRVSNYLLWQAAYAEFWFTDICWPDFTPEHLKSAVFEYSKRDRRFGGLGSHQQLESLQ